MGSYPQSRPLVARALAALVAGPLRPSRVLVAPPSDPRRPGGTGRRVGGGPRRAGELCGGVALLVQTGFRWATIRGRGEPGLVRTTVPDQVEDCHAPGSKLTDR